MEQFERMMIELVGWLVLIHKCSKVEGIYFSSLRKHVRLISGMHNVLRVEGEIEHSLDLVMLASVYGREDSLQGIQFECWTGKVVFVELGNCVIVLIKMHFILYAKVMATQQKGFTILASYYPCSSHDDEAKYST